MKLLIVSDFHHFSTRDVFEGYVHAAQTLKIDFDVYQLFELKKYFSYEICMELLVSNLVRKDLGYTHVLFICGTMIPSWVYEVAKEHNKVGVIATDDPHSSMALIKYKQLFDWYFTNERTMKNEEYGFYYIPTATAPVIPPTEKEKIHKDYWSDVCFVGTLYPDRETIIDNIQNWCNDNKRIFFNHSVTSTDQAISNLETRKVYAGSKVVINIDRNPDWWPSEKEGNSYRYGNTPPESGNPRMYETALCRSIQLFVNPRQEAIDIFGDNVYVAKPEEVGNVLEEIFNTDLNIIKEKIDNCFNIVMESHLYKHRLADVLRIMKGEA